MKLSPWPWLVIGLLCIAGYLCVRYVGHQQADGLFVVGAISLTMFVSITWRGK